MEILLDTDARWCRDCTILEEVEPEAHEATCSDCRDSDENKDVVMADPYFARVWKALQYKKSGIPVLDLVTDLDDALCIQAVEAAVSEVEHEQREAERQRGAGRDDPTHPPRDPPTT